MYEGRLYRTILSFRSPSNLFHEPNNLNDKQWTTKSSIHRHRPERLHLKLLHRAQGKTDRPCIRNRLGSSPLRLCTQLHGPPAGEH